MSTGAVTLDIPVMILGNRPRILGRPAADRDWVKATPRENSSR